MAVNLNLHGTREIIFDSAVAHVSRSQRICMKGLAAFYSEKNRRRTPPNRLTVGCVLCGGGNETKKLGGFVCCRERGSEFAFHERCILSLPLKLLTKSRRTRLSNFFYEFSIDSLVNGIREVKNQICTICGKNFASVVCCGREGCSNVVHVPCALENKWRFDNDAGRAFCNKHLCIEKMAKDVRANMKHKQLPDGDDGLCALCSEKVEHRISYKKTVVTSCCKVRFTHYKCLEKLALVRGADLLCAMCNIRDEEAQRRYHAEIGRQGIFIPDWIADYEDLLDDRLCEICGKHDQFLRYCCQCGTGIHEACCGEVVTRTWLCFQCRPVKEGESDQRTLKEGHNKNNKNAFVCNANLTYQRLLELNEMDDRNREVERRNGNAYYSSRSLWRSSSSFGSAHGSSGNLLGTADSPIEISDDEQDNCVPPSQRLRESVENDASASFMENRSRFHKARVSKRLFGGEELLDTRKRKFPTAASEFACVPSVKQARSSLPAVNVVGLGDERPSCSGSQTLSGYEVPASLRDAILSHRRIRSGSVLNFHRDSTESHSRRFESSYCRNPEGCPQCLCFVGQFFLESKGAKISKERIAGLIHRVMRRAGYEEDEFCVPRLFTS